MITELPALTFPLSFEITTAINDFSSMGIRNVTITQKGSNIAGAVLNPTPQNHKSSKELTHYDRVTLDFKNLTVIVTFQQPFSSLINHLTFLYTYCMLLLIYLSIHLFPSPFFIILFIYPFNPIHLCLHLIYSILAMIVQVSPFLSVCCYQSTNFFRHSLFPKANHLYIFTF